MRVNKFVVIVVVLLLGVGFGLAQENGATPELGKRVAVLDFTNQTGRDIHNGTAMTLSIILTADLASTPGIVALERSCLAAAIQEAKLADFGLVDQSNALRLKKAIDAEYLVQGRLNLKDGKIVLSCSILCITDQKVVELPEISGAPAQVLDLEKQLHAAVLKELRPGKAEQKPAAPKANIKMAVLPLANLTSENRAGALSEIICLGIERELGEIKTISLLTRNNIESILAEQKLTLSGLPDKNSAVQIGKILRVDLLLLGSILLVENQLRIDMRGVDAASGKVRFNVSGTMPFEKAFELQEKIVEELCHRLQVTLSKDELAGIERTRGASKESWFHLQEAVKLARESKIVPSRDEKQSLESVLFLDAIDANSEVMLVSRLVESQMYTAAYDVAQRALKRNPSAKERAEILLALSDAYNDEHRNEIRKHIVATCPDTPGATVAAWLYGEFIAPRGNPDDEPEALKFLDIAKKDMDTVRKIIRKQQPHEDDPDRYFAMIVQIGNDCLAKPMQLPLLTENDKNFYLNVILAEFKRNGKAPNLGRPYVEERLDLFIKQLNEKKFSDAREILDNLFSQLGAYQAAMHPYDDLIHRMLRAGQNDEARKLTEWIYEKNKDTDKLADERDINCFRDVCVLLRRCHSKNNQLLFQANGMPADMPDRDTDYFYGGLCTTYLEPAAILATDVINNDPEKALTLALKFRKNIPDKKYGHDEIMTYEESVKYMPCQIIQSYIARGQGRLIARFIEKRYAGKSLQDLMSQLDLPMMIWFARYYTDRLEFEKALLLYRAIKVKCEENPKRDGDFFNREAFYPMVNLLFYKLGDYKGTLATLKVRFGDSFNDVQNQPIGATGQFIGRATYARVGDPLYLAGRCYEELGDTVNAQNCYARFVMQSKDVVSPENLGDVKRRMDLLAPQIKRNLPSLNWKVGLYWEGVQGWYLSSIPGKNMSDGWIFVDLFFKIIAEEKVDGVDCYVVGIYDAKNTRNMIKRPLEGAARELLDQYRNVNVYIDKTTYTPIKVVCNSQKKEEKNNATVYYFGGVFSALLKSANNGMIPYASHLDLLPPDACLFFSYPFNAQLPECMTKCLSSVPEKISVGKNDIDCLKTTLDLSLDVTVSTTVGLVPTPQMDIDKINTLIKHKFNQEQYWSMNYPWWLKIVKNNPRYVKGKSPDYARYSSLFILTGVNGKVLEVNTGLPEPFADIKALRDKFKDFEKDNDYLKYPSYEVSQIFDLYLIKNNALTGTHEFSTEPLRARRDIALAYYKDMQERCYDDTFTHARCVNLRSFSLKDFDLTKIAGNYLQKSAPDKKNVRLAYINALGYYCTEEAFQILVRHIEFCEKNKYSEQELGETIANAARCDNDQIIPLMLERYRKTGNIVYYSKLAEGLQGRRSDDKNTIKFYPVLSDAPKTQVETLIKMVEEYYNNRDQKKSMPVAPR